VATSTSLLGSFTCRKARHGTDGFTSSPKEGVLRIFSPEKIRRLRPGLNPRTRVPKASTLPLDHRSLLVLIELVITHYTLLITIYRQPRYTATNCGEETVTLPRISGVRLYVFIFKGVFSSSFSRPTGLSCRIGE
jgi:hypothetical protein